MAFHPVRATRIEVGAMASDASFGNNGAFTIASPEAGWILFFIASDGLGWEHVSVRAESGKGRQRVPSWKEMCFVKALCWDDEDPVMQLHPRRSEYVNNHPCVLHLWRPNEGIVVIPEPPSEMVGNKLAGNLLEVGA